MFDLTSERRYSVTLLKRGRSHFYAVTGGGAGTKTLEFPGVTGTLQVIAKPALIPWSNKEGRLAFADFLRPKVGALLTSEMLEEGIAKAKRAPDEKRDAAADVGTRAHAQIDNIVHGREPVLTPDIETAIAAFRDWWSTSGFRFIGGETAVASLDHKFGGTIDALAEDGEEQLWLLDWKTSSGIYPEMALQVGAYARAFAETFGRSVDHAAIVRFSKVAPVEFEAKKVRDLRVAFEGFHAAKSLKAVVEDDDLLV